MDRLAIEAAYSTALQQAFAVLVDNLLAQDDEAEVKFRKAVKLARWAKEIALGIVEEPTRKA